MNILEWLKFARKVGYDTGFMQRPNRALIDLELLGLIERNPTASFAHWRITQKGIDFKL